MSLIEQPILTAVVATYNNRLILEECLASWEWYASGLPFVVVMLVVADGCRDDTEAFLVARSDTAWGRRNLRWVREDNVHELGCSDHGFRESVRLFGRRLREHTCDKVSPAFMPRSEK